MRRGKAGNFRDRFQFHLRYLEQRPRSVRRVGVIRGEPLRRLRTLTLDSQHDGKIFGAKSRILMLSTGSTLLLLRILNGSGNSCTDRLSSGTDRRNSEEQPAGARSKSVYPMNRAVQDTICAAGSLAISP